jgi:hypothetical protein
MLLALGVLLLSTSSLLREEIARKRKKIDELEHSLAQLEDLKSRSKDRREGVLSAISRMVKEQNELERQLKETKEEEKKKAIAGKLRDISAKIATWQETEEVKMYGDIDNQIKELETRILPEKEQLAQFESGYQQTLAFENVTSISEKLLEDTFIRAEEHDMAAENWGNSHLVLGIVATTVAAVVGAGIFTNEPAWVTTAGILSLILVVATAVSTFLNAEQRSNAHYQAGVNFRVLSNQAESFVDIDLKLKQKNVEELAELLRNLTTQRDELLKKSPRVSNRFFKKAFASWQDRKYYREHKTEVMETQLKVEKLMAK